MKTYKIAAPSTSQAYQPTPVDFLAFDLGQNESGRPVLLYCDQKPIDSKFLDPLLVEIKMGFGTISMDYSLTLIVNNVIFKVELLAAPYTHLHLGLRARAAPAAWNMGGGIFDPGTNTYKLPTVFPDLTTEDDANVYKLLVKLKWQGFDLNYVHIQTHYARQETAIG